MSPRRNPLLEADAAGTGHQTEPPRQPPGWPPVSPREQEEAQRRLMGLMAGQEQPGYTIELEGPCLRLTGPGVPVPLVMQLARAEDGRLICTGLVIGGGDPRVEVTTRALHAIKLGELRDSLAGLLRHDRMPMVQPRRPGPQGRPDEHYEQLARWYLDEALVLAPRSPIKWLVENHYEGTDPATIHRWLQRARDKKLIPRRGRRGAAGQTSQTIKRTRKGRR